MSATPPRWDGKSDVLEWAMSHGPAPKTAYDLVDELIAKLGAKVVRERERSESPIETRMLAAFVECGFGIVRGEECRFGLVCQQVDVTTKGGLYRLDFAVVRRVNSHIIKIAIEVDGFEFHHRTKDQVVKDYRRDRALAERGWTVLRYLGSEIWKDAGACALDAAGVVIEAVDRLKRSQ